MSFSSARASKGAQEAAAIKPATTTRRVAAEMKTIRWEVIQIVTGVGDKHRSRCFLKEPADRARERDGQICIRHGRVEIQKGTVRGFNHQVW